MKNLYKVREFPSRKLESLTSGLDKKYKLSLGLLHHENSTKMKSQGIETQSV